MRTGKLNRAVLSVSYMSADEKRAMVAALECLREMQGPVRKMEECLADIGLAMQRTSRRRESNRETEPTRRRLVGVRLPIAEAERCKKCAELEGVSLYRFVVRALAVACESAEKTAAQRLAFSSQR